jgi:hypothetical protein
MRDLYKAKEPERFADVSEDSEAVWDGVLYRMLATIAAAYLIHHGEDKALPHPGDLSPDGRKWEGIDAASNRAKCWELAVAREAGLFLRFCDKAGIIHFPGDRLRFRFPEKPYPNMQAAAGIKEAIREEMEWDKEKPFTDEDLAGLLKVKSDELPAALRHVAEGHVFCFFQPLFPRAMQLEWLGGKETGIPFWIN